MEASKISAVTNDNDLSERAALLEQALSGQGEMLAGARRAHALLASTFNAISDAIIVTDATGRVTQANDAVLRLFNRDPDDVIGDTCHSMLDESRGCPHLQMPEDESVIEIETLNRARDRALNLRVSHVPDPESGSIGFIHVIRDVTRERVIERHLIQAERYYLHQTRLDHSKKVQIALKTEAHFLVLGLRNALASGITEETLHRARVAGAVTPHGLCNSALQGQGCARAGDCLECEHLVVITSRRPRFVADRDAYLKMAEDFEAGGDLRAAENARGRASLCQAHLIRIDEQFNGEIL
jgi:PAS domain S-box-containing protein